MLPNLPWIPESMLSDNGPEFRSHEFTSHLDEYGIRGLRSSPYKPAVNGAVERANHTITELPRILVSQGGEWDTHLP